MSSTPYSMSDDNSFDAEMVPHVEANEGHCIYVAVITIARMNPPTSGHARVIQTMMEFALEHNAKNVIILLSVKEDNIENPLSPSIKFPMVQSIFDFLKEELSKSYDAEKCHNLVLTIVENRGKLNDVVLTTLSSLHPSSLPSEYVSGDTGPHKFCLEVFLGEDRIDTPLFSMTAHAAMRLSPPIESIPHSLSRTSISDAISEDDPITMSGTKLRSFALASNIMNLQGHHEAAKKYHDKFIHVMARIGIDESMAYDAFQTIINTITKPTPKSIEEILSIMSRSGIVTTREEIIANYFPSLIKKSKAVSKSASKATSKSASKGGKRTRRRRLKNRTFKYIKKQLKGRSIRRKRGY
jgi:hypothetical protein